MKKLLYVGGIITALAVGAFTAIYFTPAAKDTDDSNRCPDEWYENRMPMIGEGNAKPEQYFVFDGERVELDDVDVDWIKANCPVNEPSPVY